MSRSVFLWYGLAVAALFGRAAWLASLVAHPVPLHFRFDGTPDAWGTASSLYGLPAVATFVIALLLGVGAGLPKLARSAPDLVNLPRKKLFLALPPEARERCVAPLVSMTAFLPLPIYGLFLWILEECARLGIQGASSDRPTVPWTPATLPIAALLIALFVYSGRAGRAVLAETAAVGPAASAR